LSVARAAGASVALAGAVAVAGALLRVGWMAGLGPGQPAVKANTALAFALAGLSLLLRCRQRSTRRLWPALAAAAAVLVASLGLLSLLEYLTGFDLGVDQLLVQDAEGIVRGSPPGRMSAISAFNFTFVGAALLLMDRRTPDRGAVAPLLTVPVAVLALLTLTGHLHGSPFIEGLSRHTAMRVPVTIQFLILCAGILLARPTTGPLPLLTSGSLGGMMLRRCLWIALVGPLVVGWTVNLGKRARLYDADFAAALIVTGNVLLLVAAIASAAWLLHRADRAARREQPPEIQLSARRARRPPPGQLLS
jgi:hypothetical protein